MAIDLRGRTALVTGASSGLGEAFARRLAAAGANLIVTARRGERLTALAEELRARHAIEVTVIALDLAAPAAPAELFAATESAGLAVDVLVNNAGSGIHQNFVDIPWEQTARQLQLNVVAVTELTHRFARAMLARGRGHILNIASVGAYTPSPTYATYAAGKAYVRDFSEAIAHELRDTPVRVCSFCPGGTFTEFHAAAGHTLTPFFRATFMTAERCAAIGLDALFAGRRNVIPGLANELMMFAMRFVPRRLIVWSTARTMGEPDPPAH